MDTAGPPAHLNAATWEALAAMGGLPSVILLMTHFLNGRIVAQARKLRAEAPEETDVVVLYNRSDDPNPGYVLPPDIEVFAFGAENIRGLGYPRKGRRLNARDVELFVMHFHRRRPGYVHYWVVEYDVAFSGRWTVLFDAFADSDADLLATTLHRHAINPGWENWRSVSHPEGRPPSTTLLRAFMPFYRVSRHGLAVLDAAYSEGWTGHYESTVPTILHGKGLVLEDIGGDGEFVRPGNVNRFYTNNPGDNTLAPGSFVFRPVRVAPGPESDTLWHPVKPPTVSDGWTTGRRHLLSRWASGWARAGMTRLARLWGR
jgi:hypothetical protein